MEAVFNMGVGLVVVVPAGRGGEASQMLKGREEEVYPLGEVLEAHPQAPRAAFAG
jgi:phosphoribosylaminoimidazole (AIR) synthetase